MKIILLRHGDRGAGYGDVHLSGEGQQQAIKLAANPALQNLHVIRTSPKLRTQETVTPLAQKLNVPFLVEAGLDQRKSIETPTEFLERVLNFLDALPEQFASKNVLLCTHSDWLQTAVLHMRSTQNDTAAHCFFGCAEFKTLTMKNDFWEIQ